MSEAHFAWRFLEALSTPFVIGGHQIVVSTSIGIACFPEDGEDIETLIRNADAASYRAKSQGENNFCRYSPDMDNVVHGSAPLDKVITSFRAVDRF